MRRGIPVRSSSVAHVDFGRSARIALPTAVACGCDASADLGEHPHEVRRRLHLRDVDDLVAVEHGQVDRLAERIDDLGHVRAGERAQALGAGRRRAASAAGRASTAGTAPGARSPRSTRVRTRRWMVASGQLGLGRQLGQPDHAARVGHDLEDREGPIQGLHAARLRLLEAGSGSAATVPPDMSTEMAYGNTTIPHNGKPIVGRAGLGGSRIVRPDATPSIQTRPTSDAVAKRERLGQRVVRPVGMLQPDVEGAAAVRAQPDRVEALADAQVADLVVAVRARPRPRPWPGRAGESAVSGTPSAPRSCCMK